MEQTHDYDPRYLAGIILFNRGDFFEAHEAWEDLWTESTGPERRFIQGLIQAAVGLCHFINGNLRGAAKLYRTSRTYMEGLESPFLGLDVSRFWQQMELCFQDVLAVADPDRTVIPDEGLLPEIELQPEPTSWPDPAPYMTHE